jgi:hypothetical protein
MLCDRLKTFPSAECFAKTRIVARIELETPQIIYVLACDACKDSHSFELSALEGEPAFARDWLESCGLILPAAKCARWSTSWRAARAGASIVSNSTALKKRTSGLNIGLPDS